MNFGKTKVRVETEGCIGCGTRWCSGWRVYATLPVKIGEKKNAVDLHICADCDVKGVKPHVPDGAVGAGQTTF